MKNYQQSYLTGAYFTGVRLAIPCSIGLLPIGYLLWLNEYPIALLPAIIIGIIVEFSIFGLIVDVITKPFKSTSVCLDEKSIIIDNDTKNLTYEEVTSISLNLGKPNRPTIPPYVTLYNRTEREWLTVNRPSLGLLFTLKKRCKNASFTVENLKKEILFHLICGLICALVMGIAIFYGESTTK